jgi:hypothetical protein
MTLLSEKRFTLDGAAKALRMSRSTFDRNVLPKLEVIRHSARFVEVPESSLEKYLNKTLAVGKLRAKSSAKMLKEKALKEKAKAGA